MFDNDLSKRVENELFVKSGNADNIVLFWDECQDASSYILEMYRVEESLPVIAPNEKGVRYGFIKNGTIKQTTREFKYKEYSKELANQRPRNINDCYIEKTVELEEKCIPSEIAILGDTFIRQIEREVEIARIYDPFGSALSRPQFHKAKVKDVEMNYKPISIVKPLCSYILDRSTFYKSIDGLPNGPYITVLTIEGREGSVLKKTYPYYFEIFKR